MCERRRRRKPPTPAFLFFQCALLLILSKFTRTFLKRRSLIIGTAQIKEVRLGELADQLSYALILNLFDLSLLLSSDELLPGVVAFLNHLQSIGLIHETLAKTKDVRGLAIRNFVGTEPFPNGIELARQVLLNVIDVVEEGRPLVLRIDGHDLPVGFAFVNHAKNTKDLDGANLLLQSNMRVVNEKDALDSFLIQMTCKATRLKAVKQRKTRSDAIITYTRLDDSHTNLANIDGIIVAAASLGVGMEEGRILPGSLWNDK